MIPNEKLRVTLCGAGRTGHLAAILFSLNPAIDVTLYSSRSETVTAYKENDHQLQAVMPDGQVIKTGSVRMTEAIDEACSKADIIIITTPSHVRESLLQRMAPILPK
ncbi:hypothetical protein NOM94_19620, partial [Acinetobacter baumannii]|nr:hypothetical protein [Acinetobacter baumannii]